MSLDLAIREGISKAFASLYSFELASAEVALQETRKEFEGSFTFTTFQFAGRVKKRPDELAQELGDFLKENVDEVEDYNVVKGFLNIVIADSVWLKTFNSILKDEQFGSHPSNGQTVMVEYSSPNTNKPLHLGHLRNNFLGYSISQVLKANGYKVVMANLINDRGIHICKSMIAYLRFGGNKTPEEYGKKGDHMVGDFYVRFDQEYKSEIEELIVEKRNEYPALDSVEDLKARKKEIEKKGKKNELSAEEREQLNAIKELFNRAEKEAPIFLEAQDLLRKWEAGEPAVYDLWKKMNGWVYAGFEDTYKRIGVSFDKYYYESDTYLLGKDLVMEGLEKGAFYKKEDGSVWCDLTNEGLDEKLVQRGDGTSVYMTQDMGTADLKYKDFTLDKSIYVVGNEQDYHFDVLKRIMKRLERPYAEGIYHMSYGMVDLPHGRMKSREGTVVDADDLVDEMVQTAKQRTDELGKIDGFTEEQAEKLYHQLALGALKYFILRVDPKKRMVFNPEESVDFQGDTGPSIQYTFARISALLRKGKEDGVAFENIDLSAYNGLEAQERDVIVALSNFPKVVADAGRNYAPSEVASYAYDLSRVFSRFYAELPVFKAEPEVIAFRLALSSAVAKVIEKAMNMLGVEVPERM